MGPAINILNDDYYESSFPEQCDMEMPYHNHGTVDWVAETQVISEEHYCSDDAFTYGELPMSSYYSALETKASIPGHASTPTSTDDTQKANKQIYYLPCRHGDGCDSDDCSMASSPKFKTGKSTKKDAAAAATSDSSCPPSPKKSTSPPTTPNRRRRTNLSPQQVRILTEVLQREPFPTKEAKQQLATKLNLDLRIVQVWFQNQRQKAKNRITSTTHGALTPSLLAYSGLPSGVQVVAHYPTLPSPSKQSSFSPFVCSSAKRGMSTCGANGSYLVVDYNQHTPSWTINSPAKCQETSEVASGCSYSCPSSPLCRQHHHHVPCLNAGCGAVTYGSGSGVDSFLAYPPVPSAQILRDGNGSMEAFPSYRLRC